MSTEVKAAFDQRMLIVALGNILPMKKLTEKITGSVKYRRIARSIAEIGIIEPLVVARPTEQGPFMLLDGHVRLAILKELGETEARCLLASDDEGFTYNRRVNRLA